jgi:hypothetical protein
MMPPITSRAIQRLMLAATSLPVTGSPSCHFRPGRRVKVQVLKSGLTVWPSAICGCGVRVSSTL